MPCSTSNSNPSKYKNYQCYAASQPLGSMGITYWGYPTGSNYTIQPNSYQDISFTCTQPKCYNDKNSCNALFLSYVNSSVNSDVQLLYYLNGDSTNWGGSYLSKHAGHSAWQAIDLSQVSNYQDIGLNTLRIRNTSSNTSVTIYGFQIFRVYGMCTLSCEGPPTDYCALGTTCPNQSPACSSGTNQGSSGSMDSLRNDYPCNFETHGGRSYTAYDSADLAQSTISAGQCFQWNFDWSSYHGDNYQQGSVCLFNFNQIYPTQNSSGDDVQLNAYLNDSGTPFATYYLGNQANHGAAPSFNLMAASGYNDTGANTVKLVNNSDVPVYMQDPGGINIYRIYVTNSVSR